MVFLSALLVVAWFRLVRGENQISRGALITWGLVAVLLSLTHFHGALLVLTLAITAASELLRSGKRILARRIVVITVLALIPLAGWAFYARSTLLDRSGGAHWLQSPPGSMILDFFGWVAGGTYLSAVLLGAVLIAALILVARWQELSEAKWPLLWLTVSIFVVLAAAQLVSLWTPIWLDKYGIVLVPPIAVALAYLIWLVTQPNMRRFLGTTVVVGAALLTSALNDRTVIPVEPWRELAKEFQNSQATTALVVGELEQGLWSEAIKGVAASRSSNSRVVKQLIGGTSQAADTAILFSPYAKPITQGQIPQDFMRCYQLSENQRMTSQFGIVFC
jgi:hypothetical protein